MKIAIYTLFQQHELNKAKIFIEQVRHSLSENCVLYILVNDTFSKELHEYCASKSSLITILCDNKNYGVATGRNILISRAISDGCDFFISCDTDIFYPQDYWYKIKVAYAEIQQHDKNIGFVQPVLLDGRRLTKIMGLQDKSWDDVLINNAFYQFTDIDYLQTILDQSSLLEAVYHVGTVNIWKAHFDLYTHFFKDLQKSLNEFLIKKYRTASASIKFVPELLNELLLQKKNLFVSSTAGGVTAFSLDAIKKTGLYSDKFYPFGYEDSELGFRSTTMGLNNYVLGSLITIHDAFQQDEKQLGRQNRKLIQHADVGKLRAVELKQQLAFVSKNTAYYSMLSHTIFYSIKYFNELSKSLEEPLNNKQWIHILFNYYINLIYGFLPDKQSLDELLKNEGVIRGLFGIFSKQTQYQNVSIMLDHNVFFKGEHFEIKMNSLSQPSLSINIFNCRIEEALSQHLTTKYFDLYILLSENTADKLHLEISIQSDDITIHLVLGIDIQDWLLNRASNAPDFELISFDMHKYDYGSFSNEEIYPTANFYKSTFYLSNFQSFKKLFTSNIIAAGFDLIEKYLTLKPSQPYKPMTKQYMHSLFTQSEQLKTTVLPYKVPSFFPQTQYQFTGLASPKKLSAQAQEKLLAQVGVEKHLATLIIGVKLNPEDLVRNSNFHFILKWVDYFYGSLFDILIVEQGSEPRIQLDQISIDNNIRYEFIYNPREYNRGWGYNVAAKEFCADSEILVLMDTDVLPGDNFIQEILDCYSKYDAISPYLNIYYSDATEADKIKQSTYQLETFRNQSKLKNPVTLSGGILIIKKSIFMAVKGFEQYIGYGCEDRALDVTLMNHCDPDRLRIAPYTYLHLYHPSAKRKNYPKIYQHLVSNYGCSYTHGLSSSDYIHKNCSHTDKITTLKLSLERATDFGNKDLYKNHDLTVNGLVCKERVTLLDSFESDPTIIFPTAFTSLLEYKSKEIGNVLAADSTELSMFYNAFKGKRCFIIGNGPSLNKHDLSLLKNEYTFGVNSFYYKTRETGFRPTFYVVEDSSVMKENISEIKNYYAPFKFFPTIYKKLHPKTPNTFFFEMNRGFYEKSSPNYCVPRFSTDATKELYCGQSVTYINLQLAYFMGFTEVYLIGMDFSYTIPASHKRTGDVLLSDTDDPNHFHKDYFGKGKTWKDPKLDRVALNYKMAKLVYESVGRRIYNATIGGQLEIFERVDYDKLLEKQTLARSYELDDIVALDISNIQSLEVIRKNTLKKDINLATANSLFKRGDYTNAMRIYLLLYVSRPLPIYADNILMCVRGLGLEPVNTLDDLLQHVE
ncbi:6-hydroxymethylpterin diphosphokinase MptE-like protein [Candidatus Albibeggiatoa sp. nov. NOAA]|uniref:6-hydroxymethylpterin diphosphokinase MptE-like protein n=1 Tax=Candidatus Albibeggiatoa sp. nov. NOAA TaxID=3162724 RepID=UPI0032F7A954|nr:DUF115 domain-containing protein [Thiotrichaceae bacterium]